MPPKDPEKRKELIERCKQKREELRANGGRKQMDAKQYSKLQKEIKEQIKQIKNDPRITDTMMLLHKKVIEEIREVEIPSPLELLNNQQLAREKFESWCFNLIDTCKKHNIPKEQFGKILNSTYTKYHIAVLGMDIVPERLRKFIVVPEQKSNALVSAK